MVSKALNVLPDLQIPVAGKDYKLNLPKRALSYSQIDMYLRCPQRYYRTYVVGEEKRTTSIEAFEGICIAKTLEEMGVRKLNNKTFLLKDAVKWHQRYLLKHQEEVDEWNQTSPDEVLVRGQRFLQRFWKQEEALITPERLSGVEVEFEIELAGVPVIGIVDLLERNYAWDYKVRSKNSMRYLNVDKSLQLSLYAVAMKKEKVGYIVFVKDDLSILHKQSTRDLEKTKAWLEFTVGNVAKAISVGAFPPCNAADNFLCSKSWCEHWDTCAGAGE